MLKLTRPLTVDDILAVAAEQLSLTSSPVEVLNEHGHVVGFFVAEATLDYIVYLENEECLARMHLTETYNVGDDSDDEDEDVDDKCPSRSTPLQICR